MKYILVTGGVLSGIGKGITSSSTGLLLQRAGYKVTAVKIDPYLNVDAGTMNPYEHGEVFVMTDGAEVDLDLGNYERFLSCNLTTDHNITTGKVFKNVIEKERHGDYLGQTVQIIPHVVREIVDGIQKAAKEAKADICMVELGGTVGDIESMPFMEAVRLLGRLEGKQNVMVIHTTLVPVVGAVGEQKTKPTQHSVKELQGLGIRPDIIVGRSGTKLEEDIATKIAFFADIPRECVISAPDARSIYDVPMVFLEQKLPELVEKRLGLKPSKPNLKDWKDFADRISNGNKTVEIALIGKYTDLKDSYISHEESLRYAGALLDCKVKIRWIEAPDLEDCGNTDSLEGVNGVLVPGGFGSRGSEGKIMSAKWARENNTPYLGVCFGFQLATIEFARNVLGLKNANSSELDPSGKYSVVDILPEQEGVKDMGATMRLGDHEIEISGGKAKELYKKDTIFERHRHRYEINPEYIPQIEEKGMKYTGRDKSGRRMEILELENHPYFMASQFHPEFKSRPDNPSPLHMGLVKAALEHKKKS
ncbi:MAG: CTP synthase (glutamine hydrolyzing) [Candidatus Thermoplasmatota archaeon]|nr:CTP synthase (glutamine hydrolyzing) [Candidatus Thermoplasmatota archaeon]